MTRSTFCKSFGLVGCNETRSLCGWYVLSSVRLVFSFSPASCASWLWWSKSQWLANGWTYTRFHQKMHKKEGVSVAIIIVLNGRLCIVVGTNASSRWAPPPFQLEAKCLPG